MLRVAMLSFWHVHARDYARQATEHPATGIVAVWDEAPERGRAEAKNRGVPFVENLDDLLADPKIDAVIVDAPTNMHREVMVAAARAGKHIFTEKVLALTTSECREILAAVERSGVKLAVSLPRLYHGYTQAIKEIIDANLLGDLTLVRVRLSHNGAIRTKQAPDGWLVDHFFGPEQTGGGALVDLGCHPMYLARLFLGMPESVSANYGFVTRREVEDNAVAVLRYPHGALGIVEAGFVNRYSPFTIEVHGVEGSLLYGTPDAVLLVRSSKIPGGGADGWTRRDVPSDLPPAFDQWVAHIQCGTTANENIQAAVELTALMEAANRSALSNQVVQVGTYSQARAD